ncbi:MAG: hypothetical protein SWZ49_28755 [Cyanobacteriota bacterium]|nr:hypothetical protein [Cyanobacteriota bacterium]
MNINISQKLGLSTALIVSIVSCFPQSAQAQLFRFSGQSDIKEGSNNSVLTEFILDTDTGAIEDFTAIEQTTGTPLLNVSSPRATATTSELTTDERQTLSNLLAQLDENLGEDELNRVVKYDLNSFDGLPNYEATLYIPYRTADERGILSSNLAAFENAFDTNEQIKNVGVPGIIVRDYVEQLDANQRITMNGVDKTIDFFGVANNPNSSEFNIEKVNIPEPTTTTIGWLAALTVGGLSLRKGNKMK